MKEYIYKPKHLEKVSKELKEKVEKKKKLSFFQRLRNIFS